MEIVDATSEQQLEQVRQLFREYWHAFGFDPSFQDFARELEQLPGAYAGPGGRIALAMAGGEPAGCIALRPLDAGECEMKRLYVRNAFRGHGIGLALVQWIVAQARKAGYTRMYADTMPTMQRALEMYEAIGFKRSGAYSANATAGAIYLSLDL